MFYNHKQSQVLNHLNLFPIRDILGLSIVKDIMGVSFSSESTGYCLKLYIKVAPYSRKEYSKELY